MGIFNKSEKDDDFGKLYDYLSLKKYPYINQALEYYKLALNGYGGFCFKRNKEVILSVIYVISENLSDSTFKEQIDFAEKLYVLLDTDVNIYLNNLQVCLTNSTLIYNDECLVIDGEIYVSDEVYISYHEAYGLSSYEQYLFMPIDSYNVFCVLNDKKCICKYLPAKVCTGEYKNKVIAKTLIKK